MEIKRLRSEGLSYNDISKYLNKVGWKTRQGKKFYSSNIWTFEKSGDRWREEVGSEISDLKLEFDSNQN